MRKPKKCYKCKTRATEIDYKGKTYALRCTACGYATKFNPDFEDCLDDWNEGMIYPPKDGEAEPREHKASPPKEEPKSKRLRYPGNCCKCGKEDEKRNMKALYVRKDNYDSMKVLCYLCPSCLPEVLDVLKVSLPE